MEHLIIAYKSLVHIPTVLHNADRKDYHFKQARQEQIPADEPKTSRRFVKRKTIDVTSVILLVSNAKACGVVPFVISNGYL